jgi:hypothetical protein
VPLALPVRFGIATRFGTGKASGPGGEREVMVVLFLNRVRSVTRTLEVWQIRQGAVRVPRFG